MKSEHIPGLVSVSRIQLLLLLHLLVSNQGFTRGAGWDASRLEYTIQLTI